jgi:hypothetical protein
MVYIAPFTMAYGCPGNTGGVAGELRRAMLLMN